MDQVLQAAYDTVHNSDITSKVIAERLCIGHQVLLNKVNPNCESNKLSLEDVVALQKVTNSRRIADAMSIELGGGDVPEVNPKGIIDSLIQTSCEHGDVVQTIHNALADGRMTLREKEQCMREIDEAIQSLNQLQRDIVSPSNQ